MSDVNNDLRKRILEDEPLDGSKADLLKMKLMGQFESRRKRVRIRMTFSVLVGLAIMFCGLNLIGSGPNAKIIALGIVIALIGYEGTVLIKLWYWILETHIQVLRELKQLELSVLASSAGAAAAVKGVDEPDGGKVRSEWISVRKMRWISLVLIIAFGIYGSARWVVPAFAEAGAPWREYEEHYVVADDGSCKVTSRNVYNYVGITPLESVEIRSDVFLENAAWQDGRGNTLTYEVHPDKKGYLYSVRLTHPVFRGEQVDLRAAGVLKTLARRENGMWIFENRSTWGTQIPEAQALCDGHAAIKITKTITLPAGAELESGATYPMALMSWVDGGRQVLCYQDRLGTDVTLQIFTINVITPMKHLDRVRITYRLPNQAASQPSK